MKDSQMTGLAWGADASGVRVADMPLVILVGVTGVGKSTALSALRSRLNFSLLPDRRDLTDRFMLGGSAVTDREERFRLTARWRERHPGGMAELLAGLRADPAAFPPPLLFDGLRGEDEVAYATLHLPRARFVTLLASDVTRVRRLLGRADAFDRAHVEHASGDLAHRLAGLPGALDVLGEGGVAALTGEGVDPDDLLAKARIVVTERRHYDPDAAARVLRDLPPERSLVIDTERANPDEVARLVRAWL